MVQWLRQMAHDQKVVGSNPGIVYWMDLSYYIEIKSKIKAAKEIFNKLMKSDITSVLFLTEQMKQYYNCKKNNDCSFHNYNPFDYVYKFLFQLFFLASHFLHKKTKT